MQGRLGFILGALIVLHFTFRSIIHFELIFVRGVKSVSRFLFFFLTCRCPVVPARFVAYCLVPLYCLCSFVKNKLAI